MVKDGKMSPSPAELTPSISREREWEPEDRGMSMLLPYVLFDDVSISTKK